MRPVIIDVACQNGRFDNSGRLGEMMMYSSIAGVGVGSVAYFGGSVDISWDPPAIMAVGINKSVASKKYTYLGEALLEGHLYLIKNHSNKEDIKDNLEWYHLQGDPSLLLSRIY